jgi:E3 ubiquitin-protein ligase AIP2
MESENLIKQELEELQKQLGKKQLFEDAVSSLKSMLQQSYPSASTSLRKSVCSSHFNFSFTFKKNSQLIV